VTVRKYIYFYVFFRLIIFTFKVVENLLNMSRKLKRYIKDENSRYAKGVKEAKLKIDATKEKVIENKVLWFFYMDYYCCYGVIIIILCA